MSGAGSASGIGRVLPLCLVVEALSGVAGGALAAIVVKLPLPVLGGVALLAAGTIAGSRGRAEPKRAQGGVIPDVAPS